MFPASVCNWAFAVERVVQRVLHGAEIVRLLGERLLHLLGELLLRSRDGQDDDRAARLRDGLLRLARRRLRRLRVLPGQTLETLRQGRVRGEHRRERRGQLRRVGARRVRVRGARRQNDDDGGDDRGETERAGSDDDRDLRVRPLLGRPVALRPRRRRCRLRRRVRRLVERAAAGAALTSSPSAASRPVGRRRIPGRTCRSRSDARIAGRNACPAPLSCAVPGSSVMAMRYPLAVCECSKCVLRQNPSAQAGSRARRPAREPAGSGCPAAPLCSHNSRRTSRQFPVRAVRMML